MLRFEKLLVTTPSGNKLRLEEYDNGKFELSHGGWIQIVDHTGLTHFLHFVKCDVLNHNRKYEDSQENAFRYMLSVKTVYDETGTLYPCYSYSMEPDDHLLRIMFGVDKAKKPVREVYYNTLHVSVIEEHPMTKDKRLIATTWGKIPKLFEGNVYEPNAEEQIGFH